MSTCDRLSLQTLGSQLDMPKNLPDHCLEVLTDGLGFAVDIVELVFEIL
jgi:hypothetical protein